VSKKWTPEIVQVLITEKPTNWRFGEILRKTAISNPKTLSIRLKELEKLGLVERRVYVEVPPKVEYSITQKGKELGKILSLLAEWDEKWHSR
jgi:DNA-binding HxlR family transcriptional regulator